LNEFEGVGALHAVPSADGVVFIAALSQALEIATRDRLHNVRSDARLADRGVGGVGVRIVSAIRLA
jgi:hypothetical protein